MRLLVLLTPVVLWSQTTMGTTGVAIWTPERAVIAMDSRITVMAGDYAARGGDTCKIRPAGRFYVAIAGLNEHPATKFDSWRTAIESVAGARSIAEAMALAESRLEPELRTALGNIQALDIAGFRRHYAQEHLGIVIAGIEDGAPAMVARAFLPDANAGVRVVRWSSPRAIFIFGETKAIAEVYRRPAALVAAVGPVEAGRRLVQLEIDREPERVGGPISMVQITAGGVEYECAPFPPHTAK